MLQGTAATVSAGLKTLTEFYIRMLQLCNKKNI